MQYVAVVTLLMLIQYTVYMMMVSMARGMDDVQAPDVSGNQHFERAFRVQMNTLEQLIVAIPAMWISAYYFKPMLAAGLGVAFMLGRLIYRNAYMKDPSTRGTGMMIGFIANVGLIGTGLWGAVSLL